MASVLYRTGLNRIFYQAKSFETGKTVTGFVWSPELIKTAELAFTELEDGLYYYDHTFEMAGTHVGLFYENGVKTRSSVFRVTTTKGQFIFTGDYRL